MNTIPVYEGSVTLVDYMGDDMAVVNAARISYNKEDFGKVELTDADKNTLDYMMRHKHTSPFEQVVFKFIIEMPIFVMRQWVRHRTASLNEWSGRYSELEDKFYQPAPERLRKQDKVNKQGSSDEVLEHADHISFLFRQEQGKLYQSYHEYLEAGVAKEVARINLPLSIYTKIVWQMDLHNLFHFLKLRMDSHAQEEIRAFANAVYELIKPIVPECCKAFENHILNSVTFSADEMEILRPFLENESEHIRESATCDGALRKTRVDELMRKIG